MALPFAQVNIHATTPYKIWSYWNHENISSEFHRMRRAIIKTVRYNALTSIAEEIQETAVRDYMHRGGGDPIPGKLTERSGRLRNAIVNKSDPAHIEDIRVGAGGKTFRLKVGVKDTDDLPYASIQEKGGGIDAKHKKVMRFHHKGEWWFAKHVDLPPRPYMQPAGEKVVAGRKATEVADDAIHRILVTGYYPDFRFVKPSIVRVS